MYISIVIVGIIDINGLAGETKINLYINSANKSTNVIELEIVACLRAQYGASVW